MNTAPSLQINSQTRQSAISLKDKYLTSSASLPELLCDLATLLGRDSGPLHDTLANWISSCEEALKFGEVEPPFPPKIVVTNDRLVQKAKPGVSPSERGSGKAAAPNTRAQAKNQGVHQQGQALARDESKRTETKSKSKACSQLVSGQTSGKNKKTAQTKKTVANVEESKRKGKGDGKGKGKGKAPAEETEEEERQAEMEEVETDADAEGESEVEVGSKEVPVGVKDVRGMSSLTTRGKKRKDKLTGLQATKKRRLIPKDTLYNPSLKKAANGRILGVSMQDPIGEEDVEFAGDVEEVDPGALHVRAATNFLFVDIEGNHVSVGEGEQPTGIYLVACCGSLNPQTESGQRLLAGWWNPDPDPEEEAHKASVEVLWLKIPARSIEVAEELWLRDEKRKLIIVNGQVGAYVLQTPDPSYAPRWAHCFTNFAHAQEWVDVNLNGPCPSWFDAKWWEEVQDERKRWLELGEALDPPQIKVIRRENDLLKAQGFLAYHEAKYRALHRKIEQYEGLIRSNQFSKKTGRRGGRRTIAERNHQKDIKKLDAELSTWRTELAEVKGQIEDSKKKVALALRFVSILNVAQDASSVSSDLDHGHSALAAFLSSSPAPTASPVPSAPTSPQPSCSPESFRVPGPSCFEASTGVETSLGGPSTSPPVFGKQAAKLGDRSDVVPFDSDSDMSELELGSEARPPSSPSRAAATTQTSSSLAAENMPAAEPKTPSAGNGLFLGGVVDGLGSLY